MRLIALLTILLAACSSDELVANRQSDEAVAEPTPPPAPAENVVAVPIPDGGSPEAAVAVLKDYFRLVGEKQFVAAHKLWTTDSQLSDGAFAGSFDPYRDYRGTVTGAGRTEGAAGSSYIEVPVEVTGRLKSGERFRQTGTITLRRVNDVPGTTPEQLQWRIYRAELEPPA